MRGPQVHRHKGTRLVLEQWNGMLKVLRPGEEPALDLKCWETDYLNFSPGSNIGYITLGKSLPLSVTVSSSVNGDDAITCSTNLTGLT